MDKLIFTRFEKVYSSRKRALEKLDSIERYYAEMVAIKYQNGNSFDVLLALYQSEKKGDYVISFDSASTQDSTGKIYSVEGEGVEDLKTLNPLEKDIAILTSPTTGFKSFYLYHDSEWVSMLPPAGNTNSVKMKVEDGVLKADVGIIDCGYL